MDIWKDLLKYSLGFAVAGLLLWWVLRGSDPAVIRSNLAGASIGWILVAVVLNAGHNIFRVWRWRALLEPVRPNIPFRPMFTAVIIGYTMTWVIPGRIGELVRPMLLAEREKLPLGPCIGSVVADRIMDAISVVGIFALGAWLTPLEGAAAEHATLIRSAALTLLVGLFLFLGLMLAASAAKVKVEGWLTRRGRVVQWLGRSALSIASGIDALRSPRLLARVVLHSALAWLTIALATWAMVWSVGVQVTVPQIMVIIPLLVLGVAVPTPGGAGTYHGAMKVGLMLFGVTQSLAVSAAIVAHLIVTVPIILLGFFLIWLDKISWHDMVAAARGLKSLGQAPPAEVSPRTMESTS